MPNTRQEGAPRTDGSYRERSQVLAGVGKVPGVAPGKPQYRATFRYGFLVCLLPILALFGCGVGDVGTTDRASVGSHVEALTSGPDLTASATIIALITNPTGGGNHDVEVIRDGVY